MSAPDLSPHAAPDAASGTGARVPAAPRGLRQTMSELHIWTGLLLGWFLFAMFLTGTVSYFKEELSQWMRPEIAHQADRPEAAVVAGRIAKTLETIAPGTTQWSLRLPDERHPIANAFWRVPPKDGAKRAFKDANFDPQTGLKVAARETPGGEFFYRFHFQFHYMPVAWGRWLAGLAAMFMLVAIVSGVITHKKIFTDFFTFRWGKGQRSWLDAHNALSVFGLPFHLMITYTGLVTLMTLYMPWPEMAGIESPAMKRQLTSEMNAFLQPAKPSGEAAPLASIEAMVREAERRWGPGSVARVTAAIMRMRMPFLSTPSCTRTSVTTPRYGSYQLSTRSAFSDALRSPLGGGRRLTIASSRSSMPRWHWAGGSVSSAVRWCATWPSPANSGSCGSTITTSSTSRRRK